MGYDYEQGVAHATSKLWELLDEHKTSEVIPKDAIRELIKELEKDF